MYSGDLPRSRSSGGLGLCGYMKTAAGTTKVPQKIAPAMLQLTIGSSEIEYIQLLVSSISNPDKHAPTPPAAKPTLLPTSPDINHKLSLISWFTSLCASVSACACMGFCCAKPTGIMLKRSRVAIEKAGIRDIKLPLLCTFWKKYSIYGRNYYVNRMTYIHACFPRTSTVNRC